MQDKLEVDSVSSIHGVTVEWTIGDMVPIDGRILYLFSDSTESDNNTSIYLKE